MYNNNRIKILFVCLGNSCRSQIAEGWSRHLKANIIDAYSAGIRPIGVNSTAIKVMAEAGVDISNQKSQSLDEFSEIDFDYLITLCDNAAKRCPTITNKAKVLHKPFEDPYYATGGEEDVMETFRKVRNEIREFIEAMPDNLK
jgi:arsenate reductase